MNDQDRDEILGIVRCARCGQRLEGEIDCPCCSSYYEEEVKEDTPKWVFLTACFLTSPVSVYFIIRSTRLSAFEKVMAFSGCVIWGAVYKTWF